MNAPFDHQDKPLETRRLILRPWTPDDLDALFALTSNPNVTTQAGFRPYTEKAQAEAALRRLIASRDDYAIQLKDDNVVVGSVGFEPCEPAETLPEFEPYQGRAIGFMLSEDYWGRGIIPEAVNRLIAYAFGFWDFDFLLSGHFEGNAASASVMKKCGFKPFRSARIRTGLRIVYQTEILYYQTNPHGEIDLGLPEGKDN